MNYICKCFKIGKSVYTSVKLVVGNAPKASSRSWEYEIIREGEHNYREHVLTHTTNGFTPIPPSMSNSLSLKLLSHAPLGNFFLNELRPGLRLFLVYK